MNLNEVHTVYFLGIGGMGMSALAWFFHQKGKQVSGYDLNETSVTQALKQAGINVYRHADPAHLSGQECIIFTPALPSDHPELAAARALGLPLFKRSEILGLLSQDYDTLAVAGTHGKTTTSAMLTHLMRSCGISATAFLGGISHNLQSNYVHGDSRYAVMEADEYDRSFLTLSPTLAIITALEADHLDVYGTEEELEKTYMQFASQTASEQPLLIHESLESYPWRKSCLTYGIEKGDFQAQNVTHSGLSAAFNFVGAGVSLEGIQLPLPGKHNVNNMVGALAMGHILGIDITCMGKAVGSFSGIYRRFDIQVEGEQVAYIDDYAHHPTEVEAAIQTAKELFPERKLTVIFQPHLYSRTQDLAGGFAQSLDTADQVLLLPIYPAREVPIPGVSSQLIEQHMEAARVAIIKKEDIGTTLTDWVSTPGVILSLGAGDIDKEVQKIKNWCLEHAL